MKNRKAVQYIIGIFTIMVWLSFYIQTINIYPYNNFFVYIAFIGYTISVIGLAIFDLFNYWLAGTCNYDINN